METLTDVGSWWCCRESTTSESYQVTQDVTHAQEPFWVLIWELIKVQAVESEVRGGERRSLPWHWLGARPWRRPLTPAPHAFLHQLSRCSLSCLPQDAHREKRCKDTETRGKTVKINSMVFFNKWKVIQAYVNATFGLNLYIAKDKLALTKTLLFSEPIALLFKEYVVTIYSLVCWILINKDTMPLPGSEVAFLPKSVLVWYMRYKHKFLTPYWIKHHVCRTSMNTQLDRVLVKKGHDRFGALWLSLWVKAGGTDLGLNKLMSQHSQVERRTFGFSICEIRLIISCHHYSWKGCMSMTGMMSATSFAYSERICNDVHWVQQILINIKYTQ